MKIKKIAYIVLIPLLGILIGDLCQKQTKGFRLQNIFSSYHPQTTQATLTQEEVSSLQKIIDQPFYFMKKGQQCFAFVSQDGKYVLKLFRWEKLEAPFWTKWITTKKGQSLIQERQKKKDFDFTSYTLAYKELKEETGLLFIQLEPNKKLNFPLKIYDNIGIKHVIQMQDISFILQKKVENFAPYFAQKILEGNSSDLYPFFRELALLLENRSTKKISDSDISLEYNMGILEGKPVLFDVGNLSRSKEPIDSKEFIQKEAKLIFATLNKEAPDLSFFLQEEIEKITAQQLESKPRSPSSLSPPQ